MLWGCAYVAFSWAHAPRLARLAARERARGGRRETRASKRSENAVNFLYFFLDYTLPPARYVGCLLALVAALVAFYAGALGLQGALGALAARGVARGALAAATYGGGFLLTKWRD